MSVPIRLHNRTHNSTHSLRSAVNFLLPAGRRNFSKLLFVTCKVEHGCSVALLHLVLEFINIYSLHKYSGHGSSVCIATGYGLHGPGIIPVEARFYAPIQTGPGAQPSSCTISTGSFPVVKRPGRAADNSQPSSAVVKKE